MRSKYKRIAMKKKMKPRSLVPLKDGNPPRQSRGASTMSDKPTLTVRIRAGRKSGRSGKE